MTLTRRGRIATLISILLAVVVVPAIGGYVFLRSVGFYGASEPHGKVELTIPKGADAARIGELLEQADVIRSSLGFRLAVMFGDGGEDIQAGRYELPLGLNAHDALDLLVEQGPKDEGSTRVTFPEGSWLTDFARILEDNTHLSASEFLALVEGGKVESRLLPAGTESMEGLLFPSTYEIVEKDDERSVAERLAGEFEEQARGIGLHRRARSVGVTPYEAVIVASMIEAEASVDSDRAKIARVIYNRLERGIGLGIDATVLYALGEHKEELTTSDLAIDSPYNTRLYAGLPPTPIGAPGVSSLEAAVAPADGEWLYYVLGDCSGRHAFSESYDEFLEDKAAYQELEC